jgi:serine protease Do
LDPSTTQVLPNTIIRNEVGSAVNPTAVAIKAFPSIVTVTTLNEDAQGGLVAQGSGSGVVITADGYIATNDHVVDGASTYQVTFEDGRVYSAELIGTDPLTDLAVIKIEATDLVPVDFGSVDGLELGDPAIAVGNPLGQDGGSSISVGIISAFDRRVDFGDGSSLFGMIQTDAAINSGSSGGSLLNADGDLIGITSAIGVSNAGPEGIGYAIPVNLVQRITNEIIETGDVRHPFLGVTIETYVEELADGATAPRGARIDSIEGTDSAAGSAGLQAGDIIVGIGDKEISSQTDLILAVRLYRVGDSVTFTAVRDGVTEDYTVVMGQRPETFGG